jgi:hypothetical protein
MMARLFRRAPSAFWLVLSLFALSVFRTLEVGEAEMRRSDAAFDAAELTLAVHHARRAAEAYVPGGEHVQAAYARLRAVGVGAERARDTALAASSWRSMRAASLATRHLWMPHGRELAEANEHLAGLLGPGAGVDIELPFAPRPPRPVWVLLIGAGFLLGAGGLLLLMGRGASRGGHWSFARARLPSVAFAAGVFVFSLALLSA